MLSSPSDPTGPKPAREVVLEPFDPEYLDRIVECVTEVWVEGNVIARALGVTTEDYRPVARRICERALADELGLMLREPATDRIVGFHTSVDLVDALAEGEGRSQVGPRMRRWARLSSIAHRWYLDQFHRHRPLSRGEVFYMLVGGSRPEYRGRGLIARMTLQSSRDLAVARGFQRVLGIATHPHSVKFTRRAAVGARFHQIMFAELDDPDLARITDPPFALVSVMPLAGIGRGPS